MEAQQCFLCIVALHLSLRILWNTLRSSCKVPEFLSDFSNTWEFLDTFYVKIPVIKFHENPPGGSRTDNANRRAEREDEFIRPCALFTRKNLIKPQTFPFACTQSQTFDSLSTQVCVLGLPTYGAKLPRRTKTWMTLRREPEVWHSEFSNFIIKLKIF